MFRWHIIQKYIDKYSYKSFLEIGVDSGKLQKNISIKTKESVDPAEGDYSHAKPTYKLTSDDFFKQYPNKKYDIVFIDGFHESQQVDRDIVNSINALNDGGTILLHDCLPPTKLAMEVPRTSATRGRVWTGDVWRSVVKFIHSSHKEYDIFVVDTDLGVGVIRKGQCQCNFTLPDNLTWEWFSQDRNSKLNVITKDEFSRRIS